MDFSNDNENNIDDIYRVNFVALLPGAPENWSSPGPPEGWTYKAPTRSPPEEEIDNPGK